MDYNLPISQEHWDAVVAEVAYIANLKNHADRQRKLSDFICWYKPKKEVMPMPTKHLFKLTVEDQLTVLVAGLLANGDPNDVVSKAADYIEEIRVYIAKHPEVME